MRLLILPSNHSCSLDPALSVLENCLAANLVLPNSCRNGVCRTCLCKLQRGQVTYRIPWPGLSYEEKQENWILPCVAQAESDLEIISVCQTKLSE